MNNLKFKDKIVSSTSKRISEKSKKIRERSNEEKSKDVLVTLLYLLMRDHVPTHVIEESLGTLNENDNDTFVFCNGWLARYAKDIANRIYNGNK